MNLKTVVVSSIILMFFSGSVLAFGGDRAGAFGGDRSALFGGDRAGAFGGGTGRGGKNRLGNFLGKNPADMISRVVKLTDAQYQQIEQIHEATVANFKAENGNENRGDSPRAQMRALDPLNAEYTNQVEVLADEIAAKVKAKILARANERAQIYNVLTPEQRAQLEEFKNKIRNIMEARKAENSDDQ